MNLKLKNTDFLQKHFPDVVLSLQHCQPLPLTVSKARKGGLTMTVGEAHVHSAYDPKKEANKLFRKEPAEVHIHFGFGLGHLLQADTDSECILIYEPVPALLLETIKHCDLQTMIDPKRTVLTCDLAMFKKHAHLRIRGDASCRIIPNAFHTQQLPQVYEALQQATRQIIEQAAVALRSIEKHAAPLTIAALKTLKYSTKHPSISQLQHLFADKPAVIVSAGPSLDKNLCELVPYTDKVIIIAMGRTAKALDKYGIEPHFLVHNEPQPFFSFIQGCQNLKRTCFVLSSQAQDAYYQHQHDTTFVYHNVVNFTSRWLTERFPTLPIAYLDTGGSVANEAFSLAQYMGCNPIALIGQDLAMKGGRYYGNSDSNKAFLHSKADNRSAMGYFGEQVQTVSTYASFAHWFGEEAAKLKSQQPQRRLINATEGGICLENFENLPLRHFAHQHFNDNLPIRENLRKAAKVKTKARLFPADLHKLVDESLQRCKALQNLERRFLGWSQPLLQKLQDPQVDLPNLQVYDDAKDSYIQLLTGFSVLSGCMQSELLALNRLKRQPSQTHDPREAIILEIKHFNQTLEASSKASRQLQPIFEALKS